MAREFKKYSFKSVGILANITDKEDGKAPPKLPIGIKTPLELGGKDSGLFRMHTNIRKQISDNFRNLVNTNHGERLPLYNFGANLRQLASELGNEETDFEAMRRIKATAAVYMPYVELKEFESFILRKDNEHTAQVGIRIIYDVPSMNLEGLGLETIISTIG